MVTDYLISIDTDNNVYHFGCSSPCSLNELRKPLNNGLIEFVHIVDDMYLVVDDEGLLKHLPINPLASSIVGFSIFGNAVLCRCVNEDTYGFPLYDMMDIICALENINP